MALNNVLTGGAIYAATMVGVGLLTGDGLNLMSNATDGAIMGAAILADSLTHSMISMDPSVASSAVVTGGWFAAMEAFLRGRTNYARNVAAGAAVSVVVDTYY
jgi:hypothetical protein